MNTNANQMSNETMNDLDVFFTDYKVDFGYELINDIKIKSLSFFENTKNIGLSKENLIWFNL